MPTDKELIADVKTLGAELSKRARLMGKLEKYDEGCSPIPAAVHQAKVTKAYRLLMPMAEAPFASLVTDSINDLLEPAGIRDTDRAAADTAWGIWQDNAMDAEWQLLQRSALRDGRAFALIWPDADGEPEIQLDDMSQMIVRYLPGSRRHRRDALRRWVEGDTAYATLYRPDGLFKFIGAKDQSVDGTEWTRREVQGEAWPLPNPEGIVPAVEVAVNRRLKAGSFGYARGEYEHCTGLIDRIHLLTFLGLVVAFYMGFPLRGVIGEKINTRVLRDDEGNEIGTENVPPFDVHAGGVFQLENHEAQLAEFKAADRKNLSVFAELDQLAVVTRTPRHHFPLEQGMSNLSADAIRASQGSQIAKATGHKRFLGEGGEEILRVACAQKKVALSRRAELDWKDIESRSLAERADAASKLKDVLHPAAVAELALNATAEQIARWETSAASSALGKLLAAASSTPTNGAVPAA